MAAPPQPPSIGVWQSAVVREVRIETPTAKTFRLELSQPRRHLPGQHYVVRLTAPDGYRAQRSYSVGSAPGTDWMDLTIEMLPGGEVSGFLNEVVRPGDELEVRGPIGGFFNWDGTSPMLGVAGGSGLVPLMSMLRHARAIGRPELVRLAISVRSPEQLYYAGELDGSDIVVVYTRTAPAGVARPAGRLGTADLVDLAAPARDTYVCGSPAFCDAATSLLVDSGVATDWIRVERFGPSG
jgi:ferredoxin-NADP reductase